MFLLRGQKSYNKFLTASLIDGVFKRNNISFTPLKKKKTIYIKIYEYFDKNKF